ncbi:MAG: hypothetical protein R8M38_01800 [Mariprofundaceae bacterium]
MTLLGSSIANAVDVTPVRVLIDVRTAHSDGGHDMDWLYKKAAARGIQTLAFTDHDRTGVRYGLDPAAGVIGYTYERPSLYTTGVPEFFADLDRVRNGYTDMQFFAGTESTPGYIWSGTPLLDLTLHDAERHLITLGIERPEQVESLPSYDLRHTESNFELSLAIWIVGVFFLLIVLLRKRRRSVALLLAASYIAFMASWIGQRVDDRDAEFIDAAREQGLFVIWTHPGTLSGVRTGPAGIQLDSPPYNERVFQEPTADAFAAVYGDTDVNSVAGGLWDQFMIEYMSGFRAKPIWAVAAGDFHIDGESNEYLGNFPMDVWAKSASSKDVLSALRMGHAVAWGMNRDRNIAVKELYIEVEGGRKLIPGDEANVTPQVTLHMALTELKGKTALEQPLRCEIIVDGRVISYAFVDFDSPLHEVLQLSPGPHVVRLRMPMQADAIRMEANPFLLNVSG